MKNYKESFDRLSRKGQKLDEKPARLREKERRAQRLKDKKK